MPRRSGAGRVAAWTAVAIILLSAGVGGTSRWFPGTLALVTRTGEVLLPAEQALAYLGAGVREVYRGIRSLWLLHEENVRLRHTVERLRERLVFLGALERENRNLRALLGLRRQLHGWHVVAATVVARAPASWFDTVTIDRGWRDGVRAGMPVVGPRGLVGRVLASGPGESTVLLISDPQSGVGAMIASTGDTGVALGGGEGDSLRLELYTRLARVRPGQLVVTSGLGGFYPPGLVVGQVEAVGSREFGLVRYAVVRPAQNLDRLWHVLVVTRWSRKAGG